MKKIICSLAIIFTLYSCNNYDNINTDPNVAYTTIPSTTFSYAQKELSDYMNTPSVNENNFRLTMQYWQEDTYVNESIYDFTNRNVADNIFADNYVNVLGNLNQTKKLINAYVPTSAELNTWTTTKKNQLAITDLLMVYTFQNLVDTFGNIPYSEALDLDGHPLPKYDDAATIYADLISRCKIDVTNLSSGGSFASGDYFYNGNVGSWRKFGNSLLLKLGIAISDSNPTLAQSTVNTAISGGVFSSSADECKLNYLATSPNYNPLYANLYASGRDDFQAAKTIVDYMNAGADARLGAYFAEVAPGVYDGSPIGQPSEFGDYSAIGDFAYTPTTPGMILSYTEVAFYLAEAAARWNSTTAAAAYKTAIEASFDEWGYSANAASYIASHPYDSTNWKKSIGEQAWVAMYNQGITSWNFWRRLDYPILMAPSNAITQAGGKVPVRMTYPVKETTTNPSNYAAAATAIGGDKLTTKLFWDKF